MLRRLFASLSLAVLCAIPARADSTTPRFGLTVIDIHSVNWGVKVNTNTIQLDALVAGQFVTNTFTSSNTFNNAVLINDTGSGISWARAGYDLIRIGQIGPGFVIQDATASGSPYRLVMDGSGNFVTYSSFTAGMYIGDGSRLTGATSAMFVPAQNILAGPTGPSVLVSSVAFGAINNPAQIANNTIVAANLANNTVTNAKMATAQYSNISIPSTNIVGIIPSSNLVSTVAYTTIDNNWSHAQTSQSSWTVNGGMQVYGGGLLLGTNATTGSGSLITGTISGNNGGNSDLALAPGGANGNVYIKQYGGGVMATFNGNNGNTSLSGSLYVALTSTFVGMVSMSSGAAITGELVSSTITIANGVLKFGPGNAPQVNASGVLLGIDQPFPQYTLDVYDQNGPATIVSADSATASATGGGNFVAYSQLGTAIGNRLGGFGFGVQQFPSGLFASGPATSQFLNKTASIDAMVSVTQASNVGTPKTYNYGADLWLNVSSTINAVGLGHTRPGLIVYGAGGMVIDTGRVSASTFTAGGSLLLGYGISATTGTFTSTVTALSFSGNGSLLTGVVNLSNYNNFTNSTNTFLAINVTTITASNAFIGVSSISLGSQSNNATAVIWMNAPSSLTTKMVQIGNQGATPDVFGDLFDIYSSTTPGNNVTIVRARNELWFQDGNISPYSNPRVNAAFGVSSNNLLALPARTSCTTGLQTNSAGEVSACVASDRSLKTGISNFTDDASSLVDSLSAVHYSWIDTDARDARSHIGFIAQEVEKVIPQAVVSAGAGLKGLDSNALIAILVKDAQESHRRIEALEAAGSK